MSWRSSGLVAIAVSAMLLGGCQTLFCRRHVPPPPVVAPAPPSRPVVAEPKPAPVETRPPPAPRNCVPKTLGKPPRYPDTDAALREAPGAADRYQLMAAGRLLRQDRLADLERVVAGCR